MADGSPDYSNNPLAPNQVTWTADGTGFRTTLSNAVGGTDPKDYVTFTVPAGQRLTSFELSSYSSADGVAFIALQPGLTVTGSESNTTPFSGYTHFGSSSSLKVGTNLISVLGAPLEAGTYSAWIQQLGASTDYSFTLKTVQLTPTYGLTATSTSVNEGANAVFTLTTTNVSAGTVLTYTLSGVTESDITGGLLTGTVTIGANGQGTITVGIAADLQTDGTDTLKVTVGTASATMTIADTSKGVYLYGTSTGDKLVGEVSNDSLYGYAGHDTLDGGAGSDYLNGGSGNDYIVGGIGNDTITGENGNDLIYAGEGNDWVRDGFDYGDDTVFGGNGDDFIVYDSQAGRKLLYGESGDDTVVGGYGDDTLVGGVGNDYLNGGEGSDSLDGGSGEDSLYGEAGIDTLEGGEGNDFLSKYLKTEPGLFSGDDGADTVWGSDSNDTIEGKLGDDSLIGNQGDDQVSGSAGNDYLSGLQGNDTLDGGSGSDTLYGGVGNDSLLGGTEDDRIITGDGQDTVYGGGGNDQINGYLNPDGSWQSWFSVGPILGYGDDGDDFLYGSVAADSLFGGNGNDFALGRNGNDFIVGEAGRDRLLGGLGSDKLDGGDGIDTAIFEKARSAYKTEKLSQDGITIWKVTDLATGDVDELHHIEKLEFAKASVAGFQNLVQTEVTLDVAGTPAVAYRLYKAAFARDPDLGGLGYWVSELQQYLNPNLSPEQNPYLLDVAKTFVESKEFKDKYGADVDNATYIRNLYKNALGRDPLIPDPITGKADAGYTYWVGVLDAKAASRSDLFVYFSESTENKAAVAPIIATGVEYVPWVPPGG